MRRGGVRGVYCKDAIGPALLPSLSPEPSDELEVSENQAGGPGSEHFDRRRGNAEDISDLSCHHELGLTFSSATAE